MLCFRDGARRTSGERFTRDLLRGMQAASSEAARTSVLLRAGELEAALEDGQHPAAARARQLSDDAARAWLSGSSAPLASWLADGIAASSLPAELRLVRPEGYAYYALTPSAYVQALGARREHDAGVAVVGVRSIGTSLSAVLRAALAQQGVNCERITVRPQGHPWDRRLELSGSFEQFVGRWRTAHFLVVDEGPGLSGSTFLAVGEALERAGIAPGRIEFMTSRAVEPARLIAREATRRWSRYRVTPVAAPRAPEGTHDLSAGAWRSLVYAAEREWPACDIFLERHKYLEPGGVLVKFVGLPPYDEPALERGQLLAAAGFCPAIECHSTGYAGQRWVEGSPLRLPVLGTRELERLLDYLVFRSQECRASEASLAELNHMLHVNVAEALGRELPAELRLTLERPVYADARLAPQEWVRTRDGALLKVDATDHGDDHIFPGACDSAWDLAGAIIEWRLAPARARELCAHYRRRTRDDIAARLGPYLLAYAALRVAQTQTAALSAAPAERRRLQRDRRRYLGILRRFADSQGSLDLR